MKHKLVSIALWLTSLLVAALVYLYVKLLEMGEYASGEECNVKEDK